MIDQKIIFSRQKPVIILKPISTYTDSLSFTPHLKYNNETDILKMDFRDLLQGLYLYYISVLYVTGIVHIS